MNRPAILAVGVFAAALALTTPALALREGDAPSYNVENDVHHPDCSGLVKDIAPGAPTPIAGTVYVKAGDHHYNVGAQPAGYVAGPQGGHAVSHVDVCPPAGTTTTSTSSTTSTTSTTTTSTTLPPTTTSTTTSLPPTTTSTTTTTEPGTTTTTTTEPGTTTSTTSTTEPGTTTSSSVPTGGLFAFSAVGTECIDGTPMIFITFPPRPELNGQTGPLVIRDSFGDIVATYDLTFIAGATVEVFYPPTIDDVVLTYTLGEETATAEAAYPNEGDCSAFVTTTTTIPGATTTTDPAIPTTTAPGPTTTLPGTTTTAPAGTTTTPPPQLPPTR